MRRFVKCRSLLGILLFLTLFVCLLTSTNSNSNRSEKLEITPISSHRQTNKDVTNNCCNSKKNSERSFVTYRTPQNFISRQFSSNWTPVLYQRHQPLRRVCYYELESQTIVDGYQSPRIFQFPPLCTHLIITSAELSTSSNELNNNNIINFNVNNLLSLKLKNNQDLKTLGKTLKHLNSNIQLLITLKVDDLLHRLDESLNGLRVDR